MKRIILIVITLIFSVACMVATIYAIYVSRDDYFIEKFNQLVPQLMEKHKVPGVAIALVRNGELAWSAEFGLADKARGVPVSADTVFQAASISKAVTSWGVMRLVEKGLLELDAPVEQYLTRWHMPPSAYDPSGVTIRRLLSHNAGLSVSGYPGLPLGMELPSLEESLSGYKGGGGKLQIFLEPGAEYSYSGGGFTLLQLIIEEVTGESFSAYMQHAVLDPLEMSHSSFEWREDLQPKTAVPYNEVGSSVPIYLFTEQAAAGLNSTAGDLARFVAAEMPGPQGEPAGRGILAPETLELMFEPLFKIQTGVTQGLGQSIAALPGRSRVVQHWGANQGWNGYIAANPDKHLGLVVLTNSANGSSLIFEMNIVMLISQTMEWLLPFLIIVLILVLTGVAFLIRRLVSQRKLGQQGHV